MSAPRPPRRRSIDIPPPPLPSVEILAVCARPETFRGLAEGAPSIALRRGSLEQRGRAAGLILDGAAEPDFAALRAWRAAGDGIPVLVFGTDTRLAHEASLASALFVHGMPRPADLARLCELALAYAMQSPEHQARWVEEHLAAWIAAALPEITTPRPAAIVAHHALGRHRREIAAVLGIGVYRVDEQIARMLRATHAQRLENVSLPFAERIEALLPPGAAHRAPSRAGRGRERRRAVAEDRRAD